MYKQDYMARAAVAALHAMNLFRDLGPIQMKPSGGAPVIVGRRNSHHGWDRKKNSVSPRAAMRRKSHSRRIHASKRHAA